MCVSCTCVEWGGICDLQGGNQGRTVSWQRKSGWDSTGFMHKLAEIIEQNKDDGSYRVHVAL